MMKQKNIFTFYKKNWEILKLIILKGVKLRNPLFSVIGSLSTAFLTMFEYKTMSSTQSMFLCQHILASQKPFFANLNFTKTERNGTARLGQTLTMILTEADCQLEWCLGHCATSRFSRSVVMQQTVREEVTKVQGHPSIYNQTKQNSKNA